MEQRGQKLSSEGLSAHSRRSFPHFLLCYRADGRFLGTEPSFHFVESGINLAEKMSDTGVAWTRLFGLFKFKLRFSHFFRFS